MRTVPLGDGLTVSAIGLGAMGMSAYYGPGDEAESIATLRYAVDQGVTLIDTAEAYGPFENEKLIARALGHRRDEITLATKASSGIDDEGTSHGRDGTPAYIKRACERSLRHLGTTSSTSTTCTGPTPTSRSRSRSGDGRARRGREGSAHRAVGGVGHDDPAGARGAPTRRRAVGVLALLPRRPPQREKAVMDELGIGLVCFSPLGRGTLTSSVRSLDDLAPDDARRSLPRFQPKAFAANRALVARVESIAAAKGATVAQVALAWLLAQGVVPIPGTRRRERIAENAGAVDLSLTPEELELLTRAVPEHEIVGHRDGVIVSDGADR